MARFPFARAIRAPYAMKNRVDYERRLEGGLANYRGSQSFVYDAATSGVLFGLTINLK